MVIFLLLRDHEQLLLTFRGVCMLISLLFINPISNMLHMTDLIATKINLNFDFSRCLQIFNVHSATIFYSSCGERGSNTWPSDLQIDALPTELSLQCRNKGLDNRVAYMSFLACLTLKQVNSEYHAPRKYRFMVFCMWAREHEQLFQIFRGVWMLSSLLFINPISNMLHIMKCT